MTLSYLRLFISSLTLATLLPCTLYAQDLAQDLARYPRPRCNQLLNPLYDEQIFVFSPETYQHIQAHSISTLSRQLLNRHIAIDFKMAKRSGGYFIQGRMFRQLLDEIFPPLVQPSNHHLQIGIEITIPDSAMYGNPATTLLTHFEMPLLKSGNPLIAPLSKSQVRARLHIPVHAKVATFYTDSTTWFESALVNIPDKPDVVILSTKELLYSMEDMSDLREKFPEYQVIELTDLEKQHDQPNLNQRYLILNNTKRRMMELYTASDYAVVIGANNFFEPLQAHCPVIYFKNSIMGNLFREDANEILDNYLPSSWKLMSDVAHQTHGAIGIIDYFDLPNAIRKIEKIRPEKILHPAFVNPPGRNQSRFDDILDQLEALVREQLEENGVSL